VFQEQILTPRILHVASGELYFECRSHVACECTGWSQGEMSTHWEMVWRKAHHVLMEQEQGSEPERGGDKGRGKVNNEAMALQNERARASRHFEAL